MGRHAGGARRCASRTARPRHGPPRPRVEPGRDRRSPAGGRPHDRGGRPGDARPARRPLGRRGRLGDRALSRQGTGLTMGKLATLDRELAVACTLARAAGQRILLHRGGRIDVQRKEHDEVVTTADREANELISSGLREAFPQDAIYSEETPDSWRRLAHWRVWIVDPLDGTSDF